MIKPMKDAFVEAYGAYYAKHNGWAIDWALDYLLTHQEEAKNKPLEDMTAHQTNAILHRPDAEFLDVVARLPKEHWARYDLAAVRLGYEMAKEKFTQEDSQ